MIPLSFARRPTLFLSATFVVVALAQVATQRFLIADGAPFLLDILMHDGFLHWDTARQGAHYLTQAFVAGGIALGVRDLFTLSLLFGLGLCLYPLGGLWLAWLVLPPQRRSLLLIVALHTAYTGINSAMFIISESHWAAAVFFPQLLFALFAEPKQKRAAWAASISALISVLSYESYFVLGPVLAVAALWRWRAMRSESAPPVFWVALGIVGVGGVASCVASNYFMLTSSWRTMQSVGLATLLLSLMGDVNVLISSAVLAVGVVWALLPVASQEPGPPKWLWVAIGVGVVFGLLPLVSNRFLPATLHYASRILNIASPLALAVLLGIFRWRNLAAPAAQLRLATYLLLSWYAVWQVSASYRWSHYMQTLVQEVSEKAGPTVAVSTTRLREEPSAGNGDAVFNIPWALPALSIVAVGERQAQVNAVLVDDNPTSFTMFDPGNRAAWPEIARYGVRYAPATPR